MLTGGTTKWWDPVYTASPFDEVEYIWASDLEIVDRGIRGWICTADISAD